MHWKFKSDTSSGSEMGSFCGHQQLEFVTFWQFNENSTGKFLPILKNDLKQQSTLY